MFSQHRFWRRRLVAVVLGLGLALTIFMTSCWWHVFYYRAPSCSESKPDFYAFYGGAKLMWEDRSSLYDLEKQLAVQKPIDPLGADWVLPYFYPPILALFLMPLAWLPFSAAFAVMTFANMLLLAFALLLLVRKLELGREQSLWLLLGTVCNFGVHYALLQGQTSFIALLLLTLFFFASVRKPTSESGLWAGLISFKPQLLFVPILILFSRPRFRVLLTFAAVGLAVSLLSYGLIGSEGTTQFFTMLGNAATAEDALRINPEGMHNLRALAYYFFPAEFTNYAWWGMSIAVLGAVLRYCLKPVADDEEIRQRWIKLFLGIALLTPHFHDHDLTLMVVPTALALKSYGEPAPPSVSVALIVLGLLPLLRRTVYVPLFPIMPIIFVALLLMDLSPRQTTGSGNDD